MEKNYYESIAKQHQPKKSRIKNCVIAFLSGGTLALFAEWLMTMYASTLEISEKDAAVPMIITIIFIASLLTGFGVFDKIAKYCGAGTFIPITGFANSMTSSALESKSEGLIFGIGSNMFKLGGTVITYGIVASYILGVIRYVFF